MVTNDLHFACDNRLVNQSVLLNLSKAFDSVPRTILLSKFCNFIHLSTMSVFLFFNYLKRVMYCGELFSSIDVISVLGPIQFLIFINDLSSSLEWYEYHILFADDVHFHNSDL